MVVDSSALIAMLLGKPEAEALAGALARSTNSAMTVATWLETALAITSPARSSRGGLSKRHQLSATPAFRSVNILHIKAIFSISRRTRPADTRRTGPYARPATTRGGDSRALGQRAWRLCLMADRAPPAPPIPVKCFRDHARPAPRPVPRRAVAGLRSSWRTQPQKAPSSAPRRAPRAIPRIARRE